MPPELAIAELRRCAGTQFRGRLVDLFVGCLDAAPTTYREGADSTFSLDGQRRAILAQLGDGGSVTAVGAVGAAM
jgi:hypothetical protein